jgi:2-oxoglutarate ferredoxin oxidoreductase subunit gamma
LTVGNILANAAMLEGFFVSYLPCYGAAMRGGTAHCTTSISSDEIASPVVSFPDVLIALNKPSVTSFLSRMKPGSTLLYNEDLVFDPPVKEDIRIYPVAANQIARETANERSANMVMLAAMIKVVPMVSLESLEKSVQDLMGSKKSLVAMTLKALQAGYAEIV